MDGVAARGLMSGRGPTRSVGKDEVGTCSDEAKPNLLCHHAITFIGTEKADFEGQPLVFGDQLFTGLRTKRKVYS